MNQQLSSLMQRGSAEPAGMHELRACMLMLLQEKKTPGNGAAPTAPGPAAAARNRRTSMAGDEPADVSLTMQNPELLPQYLIEVRSYRLLCGCRTSWEHHA